MPAEDYPHEPGGTASGILDEATLRALIEHIPVTVYIDRLDETGSNVYTSPQLEAELGYTVEEWVSDKDLYANVLHPEDREWVLAEYARRRDSDVPFRAEYRMIARDGVVHWYHDEATVIRDETGRPAYFHGFLLDITEQKQLAEALRGRQWPGHPHDLPVRGGDDLQVHPMTAMLAGVERPVRSDPVDWD